MTEVVERWRPVPGWEGIYEVSDLGRVRSLDRTVPDRRGGTRRLRGKLLAAPLNSSGRRTVQLRAMTRWRCAGVHVLVLEAFVGPRPPGLLVRHLDGDQLNNRLANLTWGTASENNRDKVIHGTDHNTAKFRCPQGHLYVPGNLGASKLKLGHRSCLACLRARSRVFNHLQRNGEHLDFVEEAARQYARIVGRIPADVVERFQQEA